MPSETRTCQNCKQAFAIEAADFDFYKNGENYVVNIRDLFVNGKKEYRAIKRNFNLTVEYDQEGNFIRFINK